MPKEKVETNKDKLLSDVLNEIEREYGKGSVMKLGDRAAVDIEPIPSGSLLLDDALGMADIQREELLKSSVRNQVVKQRLLYMPLLKFKKRVVEQPLLMLKMRSILYTQKI